MAEQKGSVISLEFRNGTRCGEAVSLSGSRFTLGRSSEADLKVPDPDVSRHHCCIFRQNNQWYIKDLGSTNGTFVNGMQVKREQVLQVGDHLAAHHCVLIFRAAGSVSGSVVRAGRQQEARGDVIDRSSSETTDNACMVSSAVSRSRFRLRLNVRQQWYVLLALLTVVATAFAVVVFYGGPSPEGGDAQNNAAVAVRIQQGNSKAAGSGSDPAGAAPPPGAPGIPDDNSGREGGPQKGEKWTVPRLNIEMLWLEQAGLWCGKYEITNAQFRLFQGDHNAGSFKNRSLNGPQQPVARVSFAQAQAFARWLTRREQQANRLPRGYAYRMPAVREWAALAGLRKGQRYVWGDVWPPSRGNFRDASWPWKFAPYIPDYNDGFAVSCPVNRSGANGLSIFGTAGNVWEYTTARGPSRDSVVRLKGGSWMTWNRRLLRADRRSGTILAGLSVDTTAPDTGFRLVLAPASSEQ